MGYRHSKVLRKLLKQRAHGKHYKDNISRCIQDSKVLERHHDLEPLYMRVEGEEDRMKSAIRSRTM